MPFQAAQPAAHGPGLCTGFLGHYGMRGVGEIDLGRQRWNEDPTPLFQVLKSYLTDRRNPMAPDAILPRWRGKAQQAEIAVG